MSITCPFDIKRRGVETRIVLHASANSSDPDAALMDVVYRSRLYLYGLTDGSGRSLTEIANLNATTVSEVGRVRPWRSSPPKILSKIVAGNQPIELTGPQALAVVRLSPRLERSGRPRRPLILTISRASLFQNSWLRKWARRDEAQNSVHSAQEGGVFAKRCREGRANLRI